MKWWGDSVEGNLLGAVLSQGPQLTKDIPISVLICVWFPALLRIKLTIEALLKGFEDHELKRDMFYRTLNTR